MIQSKNYPGYFVAAHKTFGHIEEGYDHILKLSIPGNTGYNNTVSFETLQNKWLMENDSYIEIVPYKTTRSFKYSTTFMLWKSVWFEGYYAFESSINPGHFLRHDRYVLKVDRFENSTKFKHDASWKYADRGKVYPYSTKGLM